MTVEVSLVCFETTNVRNGGFPAISANNNATVISDSSPPGQAGRRTIPVIWQLWGYSHSLWWAQDKCKILAPDSWDAYGRNDFSEQWLFHLPIYKKVLLPLTWDFGFHSQKYFWCSDYLSFVANFYITRLFPCPFRAVLSGSLETLSPRLEVLKIST